jgi:hypothetical protein
MRVEAVKAACHVHSLWSDDGKWSLEKLVAEFGRRGCRVLMMSEHDRGFTEDRLVEYRAACARATTEQVLVLPGIEYSEASNTIHVLVWGVVPFLGEGVPTNSLLESVKAAKGVAVLAHPSRRDAWKSFDFARVGGIAGIELWNRKYDGWAPSQEASFLLKTTVVPLYVGMDFHDRRQLCPLSMALDVRGPVTEESVLECLRAHRFHAYAFGRKLDERVRSRALPLLKVAERIRRFLSRIYRSMSRAWA